MRRTRAIAALVVLMSLSRASAQSPATSPTTRAVPPEPSVISFSRKAVHPKEAYLELARQAEAQLRIYPRDLWESRTWDPIDVELKDASLWDAVASLSNKTGLSLQRAGPDREMVISQMNAPGTAALPASTHGAFHATIGSIHRTHTIDLSTGEVKRQCIFRLNLNAEPKVRVLRGPAVTKIEQAVDENGLAVAAIEQPGERNAQSLSWSWNLSALLSPPAGAGKRLAVLRGSWRILVQTRSETIEVPDILHAANVVRDAGGRQLRIREVRRNSAETYTISATLLRTTEGSGDRGPWDEINFLNTFRVLDADGNALTRRNYGSTTAGPGNALELNMVFARDDWNGPTGEPAKLVWEVPLEMSEVIVPFEFRDLPLP